jgi:hypothetical protein
LDGPVGVGVGAAETAVLVRGAGVLEGSTVRMTVGLTGGLSVGSGVEVGIIIVEVGGMTCVALGEAQPCAKRKNAQANASRIAESDRRLTRVGCEMLVLIRLITRWLVKNGLWMEEN